MKKIILSALCAGFLTTSLCANETNNGFIETIKVNVDQRNYWMGDGSVATGVVIEETSMTIISAGIKFNERLMDLALSYETTITNDKEDMPPIFEEQNSFSYTQLSFRPFSIVDFNNIELEYENLSTSTSGEIKQGFSGKLYNNDSEVFDATSNPVPAGVLIPLNYDITELNLKYYFGSTSNPSNWYIGYRQITSDQPYIETASSTGTTPPQIRLDETFESKQLQIGFKKEFAELTKGFNIKEFRITSGPTEITSDYDELSGATSEVDWSNNLYLEPAFKLGDGDSSLYLSAYYGYDVIFFDESEAKGGGDVISEMTEYGFKLYYTF